MGDRWMTLCGVAVIGALIASTSSEPSTASSALQTDALPDLVQLQETGATIEWSVDGVIDTLSPDPILALDRIFVGTGARFAVETFAPALLYVEHGPVALGSATGGMEQYDSGQVLARLDTRQLVVENLAPDCATVLRLVVAYAHGTGLEAVVAAPQLASCETEVEPLWGSPMVAIGMEGMPGRFSRAYIARVGWPANQYADTLIAPDGPMAILVEDGQLLAMASDAGQPELIQDEGKLFLMGSRWQLANPGPGPVSALVFGVAPIEPDALPLLPPGRYTSPNYGYALAWYRTWYAGTEGTEDGRDYFNLGSTLGARLQFIGYRAPGYGTTECLAQIANPFGEAVPVERDDVRRAMGVEPEAFAGYVSGEHYSFYGCRALGETVVGIDFGVSSSALGAVLPEVVDVFASLSMP